MDKDLWWFDGSMANSVLMILLGDGGWGFSV